MAGLRPRSASRRPSVATAAASSAPSWRPSRPPISRSPNLRTIEARQWPLRAPLSQRSDAMDSIVFERETIQTPAKRDLRRLFRRFALATSLLALAGGGSWYGHDWWTTGRFIESTDDAYVGGDITVLAPKVAGLIAEVEVTDNQPVHAGDLLVKLDDRDDRAALAKAEGAVA